MVSAYNKKFFIWTYISLPVDFFIAIYELKLYLYFMESCVTRDMINVTTSISNSYISPFEKNLILFLVFQPNGTFIRIVGSF
jgi:hypothetical protein